MSPTRRALLLVGIWVGLALAAAFFAVLLPVWIVVGVALFLFALADALTLPRAERFTVKRNAPSSLSLGVWSPVELSVAQSEDRARTGLRPISIEVHDFVPDGCEARDLPRRVDIPVDAPALVPYSVFPTERGDLRFDVPGLIVTSTLGLWRRMLRVGPSQVVRVYPNFRAVMKYKLLATDHRVSELGIRKRPRRGEGLDFHQLREYRPGDPLRQIDWKVTSRLRRAISREYQDERDQQIVFLLDCGRKMHSRDDELSHFDHALNSVLLLAHVALRQGDAVGLLSFSGPQRWLAPRKGNAHLNAILGSVYDLQTSTQASDYIRAAQELAQRVTKRALIVLVSNLRDEDHEELLLAAKLLGRNHLVLLASMKERVLSEVLDEPARDFDAALRIAATHQYLGERHRAHETLRASGLLCLDVEPDRLPVALVNGYLDIKSRGVL